MAKRLSRQLDALESLYGPPAPPPTRDPFELVLWENVAYLVDDGRRRRAFAALKKTIGTSPDEILAAPHDALSEVAQLGGMHPERRATTLRTIAEIALDRFDGDVRAIAELPEKKAITALKAFPSIGAPGAEKILLFAGICPVLALDSNGLRVLLRLGYGREQKSYAATYRSVRNAITNEVIPEIRWMQRAHQLLRRHGQELCKRSQPACESCPLTQSCAYWR